MNYRIVKNTKINVYIVKNYEGQKHCFETYGEAETCCRLKNIRQLERLHEKRKGIDDNIIRLGQVLNYYIDT